VCERESEQAANEHSREARTRDGNASEGKNSASLRFQLEAKRDLTHSQAPSRSLSRETRSRPPRNNKRLLRDLPYHTFIHSQQSSLSCVCVVETFPLIAISIIESSSPHIMARIKKINSFGMRVITDPPAARISNKVLHAWRSARGARTCVSALQMNSARLSLVSRLSSRSHYLRG